MLFFFSKSFNSLSTMESKYKGNVLYSCVCEIKHFFFNMNFKRTISDALGYYDGKNIYGGRTITYLRVATYIHDLAEVVEELKSCSLRITYKFEKIALFHRMNFM